MAEASEILHPIRRVAAKSAIAVRDWVMVPSVTFLNLSIDTSLEDKYCHICDKWNPRPVLSDCAFAGLMRRKLGSNLICLVLK